MRTIVRRMRETRKPPTWKRPIIPQVPEPRKPKTHWNVNDTPMLGSLLFALLSPDTPATARDYGWPICHQWAESYVSAKHTPEVDHD